MNPWNEQDGQHDPYRRPAADDDLTSPMPDAGEEGIKGEARAVAERSSERIRMTARDVGESGRELAAEARDKMRALTEEARARATRFLDSRRLMLAREVRGVCSSLSRTSERFRDDGEQSWIAGYVDSASHGITAVADYFEQREPAQMLNDVRDVARNHPGIVLGGLFALGVAVGRFLTASEDDAEPHDTHYLGFDHGERDDHSWAVGRPLPTEERWPRYESQRDTAAGMSSSTGVTPMPVVPRIGDSPDEHGALNDSGTLRREERSPLPNKPEVRR